MKQFLLPVILFALLLIAACSPDRKTDPNPTTIKSAPENVVSGAKFTVNTGTGDKSLTGTLVAEPQGVASDGTPLYVYRGFAIGPDGKSYPFNAGTHPWLRETPHVHFVNGKATIKAGN